MLIAYGIFIVKPSKTTPSWRGIDPIFIEKKSLDGFKKKEKNIPRRIDKTALDVKKIAVSEINKKKLIDFVL